jgi:predicted amidohydrolase
MRSIHVGTAQVQSKAMDVEGNLSKMEKQIKSAALNGVEIMLFAETCIHAYCMFPGNLALAEPVTGPISRRVSEWSQSYGMTILTGMLERSEQGVHNSHLIAFPDGMVRTVRKHIMTPFEIDAGIVPGPRQREPFTINGVSCALLICADSGIPDIYDEMKMQGVELMFMGTAGGGYRKDYLTEPDLLTAEGMLKYIDNKPRVYNTYAVMPSHEFNIAFVTANALGDDGVFMTHQGQCLICDRNRLIRAQIPGTNVADHFTDQMTHAVLYF